MLRGIQLLEESRLPLAHHIPVASITVFVFSPHAQLIDSDLHYECYRYPVSQESYDARNNYVGQYANLDDVGEIYLAMLDGWLHHLRTGQRYDVDYYDQCEDAEKMLAEIKQYYQ